MVGTRRGDRVEGVRDLASTAQKSSRCNLHCLTPSLGAKPLQPTTPLASPTTRHNHNAMTHLDMTPPNDLLIDVRSPLEFSTGGLANDLHAAINIEYTSIASLPAVYAALGTRVAHTDNITLYCRSGRRSDIALQELQALGYVNVRDIGSFEEARAVLMREEVERKISKEAEESKRRGSREKVKERKKAFGALLDGLKDCE